MDPRETAQALRIIAAKIDNSKQPSRELVTVGLQQIVATLEEPRSQAEVATLCRQGAQWCNMCTRFSCGDNMHLDNPRTAAIPGFEDVEGLEETLSGLLNAISKKSGREFEETLGPAMEKLQEAADTLKKRKQSEQLDPKASPKPLKSIHDQPLSKKTGSIHWGDDGC